MPYDRRRIIMAASGLAVGMLLPQTSRAERREDPVIAATPPMGWSSGRAFPTGMTEIEVLETAQVMVDKLLASGYDLFVLDGPWSESLDGYGRPQPSPTRFPSSVDGAGFRPLTDRLHTAFLRFGVSLKRGIPKSAVERNLPVMGTTYHARDIANLQKPSGDMYALDIKKPGAQAYYDSIFKLLAEWKADFVRVDDTTAAYGEHHVEIEAIKAAIDASGRSMVLSLSSGETDLKWAEHAERHAHMWRISPDMTDDWKAVKAQFKRLKDWTPYRIPGAWPDADSLPLGRLGAAASRLTPDEQITLVSLWAITRTPILMGGDLRGLDAATFKLLSNPEVLKVNQKSRSSRAGYMKNEGDAYHYWTAVPEDGKGLYVGLFNIADDERFRYINLWEVGLDGKKSVRDLWAQSELGPVKDRFGLTLPPHGAGLFWIS